MPHAQDLRPHPDQTGTLRRGLPVLLHLGRPPPLVIFGDGGGHNCRYRSDTGRCCVAGYFIPDETYVVEMDEAETYDSSTDLPNLTRVYGDRLPAWFREHQAFLQRLQKIHDDADCWTTADHPQAKWRYDRVLTRLRDLAREAKVHSGATEQVYDRMSDAQKFNWSEVEA